jgi:hypothetical protein
MTVVAPPCRRLVGKTEGLCKEIAESVAADAKYRVLVITFRVVLATKMFKELGNGFTVYYKEEGEICANRVVVQLDSLPRVEHKAFDMVVVDEAVSVVSHTCSPLISDPVRVMQSLEMHLAAAKRVVLLDACMDDYPGYRFVQCLERIKGVQARWVRNSFIAPVTYTVSLDICRSESNSVHADFKDAAINTVLQFHRSTIYFRLIQIRRRSTIYFLNQ